LGEGGSTEGSSWFQKGFRERATKDKLLGLDINKTRREDEKKKKRMVWTGGFFFLVG